MRKAFVVVAALAVGPLSGCASIIKGSGPQQVYLQSKPAGADVQVILMPEGALVASGKTPYMATLAKSRGYFRGAKYRVVFQMPGYEQSEAFLDTSANGWYIAGNIVFGGLIGWLIVDPATGAMWSLDQEFMDVSLSPASPASPPAPPAKMPASTPVSVVNGEGPAIGVLSLADVPLSARARMVPLN